MVGSTACRRLSRRFWLAVRVLGLPRWMTVTPSGCLPAASGRLAAFVPGPHRARPVDAAADEVPVRDARHRGDRRGRVGVRADALRGLAKRARNRIGVLAPDAELPVPRRGHREVAVDARRARLARVAVRKRALVRADERERRRRRRHGAPRLAECARDARFRTSVDVRRVERSMTTASNASKTTRRRRARCDLAMRSRDRSSERRLRIKTHAFTRLERHT